VTAPARQEPLFGQPDQFTTDALTSKFRMHHQGGQQSLTGVESGFLLVDSESRVHKAHNSTVQFSHDQPGTLEEWWRDGQKFKNVAGKPLSCIAAQLTGVPKLVQPGRVGVMKRPIQHRRFS
jgi:hypothetical protein